MQIHNINQVFLIASRISA